MSKRYPGGILRRTPQTPSQTSAQGIWDMASVTQAVRENNWPIAGVPDPLSRSLRFRASASAYLNRTQGSATNQFIGTWSLWFKRGALGSTQRLLEGYTASSDTGVGALEFGSDNKLYFFGWATNWRVTTQVFRDPSAWYHVVLAVDTTQSTASNRVKIYVNGSEITAFDTNNNPSQNATFGLNNNSAVLQIGRRRNVSNNDNFFDGYMTEVYFIDGQALTPSSFGTTDAQTGVWEPVVYTGTYGANGYYLPFSNVASTATLGYDFSGNNNNWTTNNISLTSGATYDSMVDVPTLWIPYNTAGDTGALWRGNYCVWNPVNFSGGNSTITDGNLACSAGSVTTFGKILGSFGMSTGKWYWEVTVTAVGSLALIGIGDGTPPNGSTGLGGAAGELAYFSNGNRYTNAVSTAYGATYTTNDIIGVAYDADAGSITFYKNNASQGAITGLSGTKYPAVGSGGGTNPQYAVNFGQRPFAYTPPSGFRTLNTTNLPTPTIGATASTQANKYFDALLYTGNGSASQRTDISWANMQPDMVWIKNRSSANNHVLHDDVRGTNAALQPNLTNATDSPVGFGADGFGFDGVANQLRIFTSDGRYNTNGNAYVTWGWKGSGAAGVTNTAGSITSTVSANTTAGFSIVTYTGTGTAGTVGHGLGVAPAMMIAKNRNSTQFWIVQHQSLTGITWNLYLQNTDSQQNDSQFTGKSSTTVTVNGASVNTNGNTYVMYCFAQVAGYSAFGSYTGNGSSDGPFVFLGFRPAFVLVKRSDGGTSGWFMFDRARDTFNVVKNRLQANSSGAEANDLNAFDFLSNGFKLRDSDTAWNVNGGTYIYACFAESPFKYALAR